MSNNLMLFEHEEFGQIRSVVIDNEPWLVGKDVANALGYSDTDQAIRRHVDDEDKLTRRFDGSGQNRDMLVINESGLYSLIMSSHLSDAKKFKRWVTSEVLPSIRKTGSYSVAASNSADLVFFNQCAEQLAAVLEKQEMLTAHVAEIERRTSYNNYYLRLQMRSGYNEKWESNASKKVDALAKFLGWEHKKVLCEIYKTMRNEYGYNLNTFCKDYRSIKDVKYCSTLAVISYSEQLRYSFDNVIDEALHECGIEFDSSDSEPSILLDAIRQKRIS